jgi:predicted kinase
MMSAQAGQSAFASAAQVQSPQNQLEDLQRQIPPSTPRARRTEGNLRRHFQKIATILKASAPAPAGRRRPRAAVRLPDRHRARRAARRILSKIAAAYGVKMSVLVEENGLSVRQHRVGKNSSFPTDFRPPFRHPLRLSPSAARNRHFEAVLAMDRLRRLPSPEILPAGLQIRSQAIWMQPSRATARGDLGKVACPCSARPRILP